MSRYPKLIDLGLIIAAGLCFDLYRFELVSTLLATFLAVSLASLCLFEEAAKLQAAACLALIVSSLFWPQIFAFLGIVVYVSLQHLWRTGLLLALLPAFFLMIQNTDAPGLAFLFLFAALSAWLSLQRQNISSLNSALLFHKDKQRELQLQYQAQRDQWDELRLSEAKSATLEERARIAREMHDSVGHVLTRAILQAGAISKINRDEQLRAPLQALEESLAGGMTQTRESLHQLRDRAVDLRQEFTQLCNEYPEAAFKIDLDYDLNDPLPLNYRQTFLASTKEALTNVQKHSDASRVWVRLREFPAFYQLVVQDNGRSEGMGPVESTVNSREGMGLESMRQRCAALGGNFYMRREKGFGIFLTLPKTTTAEGSRGTKMEQEGFRNAK